MISVKWSYFNLTRELFYGEILKVKSKLGHLEIVTFSNELNCDDELNN